MHSSKRQSSLARWIGVLLILTVLVGVVACTDKGQPNPTSTPAVDVTSAESTSLERIRVPMGYIPNIQFAPFYVAVERGYFAQAGLELEFDYSFETDAVQFVAAGKAPFAVVSGDQVVLARAQGLPVVYITEWYQRFPVTVVSLAETDIIAPADLVGRTVGVPELFGASYIGWQALLDATGLDASEVNLEAIGYSQVPSLIEGRVEAAVCHGNNEPVLLTQEGHEINRIDVNQYADIVSNGLISSEKVIAERPELVKGFVRAFLRGLLDTIQDPDAAFEISTQYVEGLAENARYGKAVLQASIGYWETDQLGYSDLAAWKQSQQVMYDAGLIDQTVPVDTMFTNAFISQP
jgi:NitT/TauT family transport system substrate-binding protein